MSSSSSSSSTARRLVATGVAALAALATTVAPDAAATTSAAPSEKDVIAHGLLAPLSLAVTNRGDVVFSGNFTGGLFLKQPGEKRKTLFQSRGKEVGAIAVDRKGVWFVHGFALMRRTWKGDVRKVAGLRAYEEAENPDGGVTYGVPDLSPSCEADWPAPSDTVLEPNYDGIVDSHPYGTATAGGPVYVAEAAGNGILKVRRDGTVSTVALLPPIPVEITAEVADRIGAPDCAIGEDYLFEPVPTDVEIGPDGLLYVSSLPGGPEDGTVPGSVFTVDPRNGNVDQVATGLVSATGVDVAPNGDVFVSELFAGKITMIPAGGGDPSTFVRIPLPAAVEVKDGYVYATVNALSGLSGQPGDVPAGKVVRYTP